MGGPSNRRRGAHVAETIKAVYPKDAEVAEFDIASLDYAPDE